MHGCDEREESVSDSKCTDICHVIRQRVGEGIDVDIDVVDESQDDGIFVVHVTYEPHVSEVPPPRARIWRNMRSAVLCWTDDTNSEHGKSIDGNMTHVGEHTHVRVPRETWESAYTKRVRFLQLKCRRLPTTYRVSTFNALHQWDESLKCIVQINHRSCVPIVGLLLDC